VKRALLWAAGSITRTEEIAAVGRHHQRRVGRSLVEQAEQREQPRPRLMARLSPVLAGALERGQEPLQAVRVVVDDAVDREQLARLAKKTTTSRITKWQAAS
jgi:hypothetical protein